ncbi:signal peptide protein [Candidatus Magnetomorum sp. HK-1]|nr:signal peptide protein [Candidatus Magnetomorum sp. HK-1]
MAMQRCKDGLHFYDADKHSSCPYCRDQGGTVDSTRAADFNDEESGKTVAINSLKSTNTVPLPTDSDVTIGIFRKKAGFEPVVGWLVCTEGSVKGKDFRIKPGINEVGRDDTQDVEIVITGDELISRRDHAEIEYDPEENAFYLVRKKNPAVKINGKSVRQPTLLNSHDILQFGDSVFIFVPLCTENFKWVIDS